MTRALLVLAAALVLVAGCGNGDASSDGTGGETTTTTGDETVRVMAYLLRDDKVWPVAREVEETDDLASAALGEIEAGPTSDEAAELDADTALPDDGGLDLESLSITDGVAELSTSGGLTPEAEAQVVYTLTQFPTVQSVELDGAAVTRADYEEQTPAVLVEAPLAFDTVSSPLNARGTANTFEATFSFEILDSEGEVLASDFVTATSGSGMRGTFSFAQPFVVEGAEAGTLVVFELSAEDGSRTHEVEIPLELEG